MRNPGAGERGTLAAERGGWLRQSGGRWAEAHWVAACVVAFVLGGFASAEPLAQSQVDQALEKVSESKDGGAISTLSADLEVVLDVDYARDSVQGAYELGHTVTIKVTESDGLTVKGIVNLTTAEFPEWGGASGFSTSLQGGWVPEGPNIQAGDWVFASVDADYEYATYRNALQVGTIDFSVDYDAEVVSGTLTAVWWSDPLFLRCEVPDYLGAPLIESWVDPYGGPIACNFWDEGWDLRPPQPVVVMYWEPDGDRVANSFDYPRMVAQIGPYSGGNRRIDGEHAGPDAEVVVTVETDLGDPVAAASTWSDDRGHFDTGLGLPDGSLAFWYRAATDFGNGITDTLTIYPMDGSANPETDVVQVSAAGAENFSLVLQYCTPFRECGEVALGEIGVSGIVTIDLMAERGFDIRLGSSFVAYLAVDNGHVVAYSWSLPGPSLHIDFEAMPLNSGEAEVPDYYWGATVNMTEGGGGRVIYPPFVGFPEEFIDGPKVLASVPVSIGFSISTPFLWRGLDAKVVTVDLLDTIMAECYRNGEVVAESNWDPVVGTSVNWDGSVVTLYYYDIDLRYPPSMLCDDAIFFGNSILFVDGISLALDGAPLDLDANSATDALTDGLLLIRRLFGFSGTTLTNGAVAPDAARTDPAEIAAHIEGYRGPFDIDANGATDALTDGLLVIRHLFGFSGTTLINGALAPDATRTDPAEIAAYLEALR